MEPHVIITNSEDKPSNDEQSSMQQDFEDCNSSLANELVDNPPTPHHKTEFMKKRIANQEKLNLPISSIDEFESKKDKKLVNTL